MPISKLTNIFFCYMKVVLLFSCFFLIFSAIKAQTAFVMAADKMNVLYVGIENPFSIAVEGVMTKDLELVDATGTVQIRPSNTVGKFLLTPQSPGLVKLQIRQKSSKKVLGEQEFRLKRIPDPVVRLSSGRGKFDAGAVDYRQGLIAELPNFDFEAKCQVISFTLTYTRRQQDPIQIEVRGAAFEGQARAAIQAAGIGDNYTFSNIKVRCPGDANSRVVDPLVINIR